MNKLKPCPFCGGTNIEYFYDDYNVEFMLCIDCEAQGSIKASKENAIEAWNRRTNNAKENLDRTM